MGGIGSGRYLRWAGRDTIDQCPQIAIGDIPKVKLLCGEIVSVINWSIGGQSVGGVSVYGGDDFITLKYTVAKNDNEPERIEQKINLTYTACHLGGSRPWFSCPDCDRRSGVLINAGELFSCRKCCELPYKSQMESDTDRAARRIRKVQNRLGNTDWYNVLDVRFPKPLGMHWKTYDRIVARAEDPLNKLKSEMSRWGIVDLARMM
jgi:hypothetical protein